MDLWLDDVRPAPPGWTWVRTPEDAIQALASGCVARVSLDFDLGLAPDGSELTGYSVVRWLEAEVAEGRWTEPLPELVIHSANPVGRARIERAIQAIRRLHAQ